MGKRIGTVSSATLNVIWTPVRHGVRWAETPEEIPRWDITLDGSQHIHPRMSYQDFLALDSAAQQLEVEELPYTVYGEKITLKGVCPPRVHEIDAPRWENAYPQLVIRWPGLDMDALHLPRSAEFDKFGVLPKWTARGSVWKAIRNLFPLARVKHKQEQFKVAIIEVVHRFSLLFPDKGDTLRDWYDAVLEVEYISRLLKESIRISREESARKKIIGSELLYEEALKLARELSRDNKYALRGKDGLWDEQADKIGSSYILRDLDYYSVRATSNDVLDRPHKFEPDLDLFTGGLFARYQAFDNSGLLRIGSAKTAPEFRQYLAESLRYQVKGEFLYTPLGPSLSTGAWTWAWVELAEELSAISSRRCDICGVLLTNRAGAEVCSEEECRDARDRLKADAKSQRPRPTRRSVTTASQRD